MYKYLLLVTRRQDNERPDRFRMDLLSPTEYLLGKIILQDIKYARKMVPSSEQIKQLACH